MPSSISASVLHKLSNCKKVRRARLSTRLHRKGREAGGKVREAGEQGTGGRNVALAVQ